MAEPDQIIHKACRLLSSEGAKEAEEVLRQEYPHAPSRASGRKYTERQSTQVFVRDGFVDRYSGRKLVFPAALRTLSLVLPDAFPFQKNWKMSECHVAYWELFPTVDHVVPVARGGDDSEANWVCTSMLRNSAKSNWTLEELGWRLHPPGDLDAWDGLMGWFLDYADENPAILAETYIARWHAAAARAVKTRPV